ncbi:MAG: hypothetical protein WDW38_000658 [Sanguina aurantia]
MGEAAQVDELETNPEHALKPGDDVYILPLKWWHSWVQCSGFGPPGGLETPPNPASPPGPIDTTGLMHSRKGCVKDGLVLGQDYILVKPVVWEKLQQCSNLVPAALVATPLAPTNFTPSTNVHGTSPPTTRL